MIARVGMRDGVELCSSEQKRAICDARKRTISARQEAADRNSGCLDLWVILESTNKITIADWQAVSLPGAGVLANS